MATKGECTLCELESDALELRDDLGGQVLCPECVKQAVEDRDDTD